MEERWKRKKKIRRKERKMDSIDVNGMFPAREDIEVDKTPDIEIKCSGEEVFRITVDGDVIVNEKYNVTEAAHIFWLKVIECSPSIGQRHASNMITNDGLQMIEKGLKKIRGAQGSTSLR